MFFSGQRISVEAGAGSATKCVTAEAVNVALNAPSVLYAYYRISNWSPENGSEADFSDFSDFSFHLLPCKDVCSMSLARQVWHLPSGCRAPFHV